MPGNDMRATITGKTDVYFMLGHPVEQVKTPGLFNAWATGKGIDAVMLSLDLPPDGVGAFFDMLRRTANAKGTVVTVPHKQAAFRHLDHADPTAAFVEACNVIRRAPDGSLHGAMTDGLGYIAALAKNGIELRGADFLLIGAGGAGSAIAYEVARQGVARLVVIDQNTERQDALCRKLAAAFPALTCTTIIPKDFAYDVACNATPVGMGGGDPQMPYALDGFHGGTVVTDVVTAPPLTPWLKAARTRGMTIQTGIEMVEAQFDQVLDQLLGRKSRNVG